MFFPCQHSFLFLSPWISPESPLKHYSFVSFLKFREGAGVWVGYRALWIISVVSGVPGVPAV